MFLSQSVQMLGFMCVCVCVKMLIACVCDHLTVCENAAVQV